MNLDSRTLADALLIARNALQALRPLPLVIEGRVAAIIAQADAALTPRLTALEAADRAVAEWVSTPEGLAEIEAVALAARRAAHAVIADARIDPEQLRKPCMAQEAREVRDAYRKRALKMLNDFESRVNEQRPNKTEG